MSNEYNTGRDVDENMFNHCDHDCWTCECVECKEMGKDLVKSYISLKSSEEEYKKQYLKYFELLRIEQNHVDSLYEENEELKKPLKKCCPYHPLQCPVDVCINKTTGAPIEQCDSLRSPYVCYTTQQHPFQWGVMRILLRLIQIAKIKYAILEHVNHKFKFLLYH
jgi:hypothetical protein